MPTYLSPGVYVEEVEAGSRPIEGVGTSVAAFVGLASDGPINEPVLVTNWSQFTQAFGEFMEGSFGIKWEDPVEVGMQKMKAAAGNATPMGQMKSAAGAGGPPPGPSNQVPGISKPQPQGAPMAAQGGLGSLMGG